MKSRLALPLLLAAGALASACGSASDLAAASDAASAFRGATTTASGFSTWDADLADVEATPRTGSGVYVAVLDTGLVPNWRDYFPEARVATELGAGFDQPVTFGSVAGDACALGAEIGTLARSTWVGSTGSTHGTHVASTILGYYYRSNFDALQGFPLPPIMVRGIAPNVTVIPVRVLADYQVPARPLCTDPGPIPAQKAVFGTSAMVAAGIDYVTDLAIAGYRPMVVNMSLGGPELEPVEQAALDRAIANGVVVVASAGNEGEEGMGYPGAYPPVISVGSAGWIHEWRHPASIAADPAPSADATEPRYRLWWLQSGFHPYQDVTDPTTAAEVYLSDFSSRGLAGQELDVLAPGSWVRGPFPGDPGYAHLPWWSAGIADLVSRNPGNFYYVGGTSMASPHVASIAALMLEADPSLTQAEVEAVLKSTALPIPADGSAIVHTAGSTFEEITWRTSDGTTTWDTVGSGLVQAGAAVSAVSP